MVTEQEIKNRVFTVDFQSPEHSFLVTDSQMRGFDENRRKLASKINEYLLIFEKEHNYSRNRTYEELVDLCQQSGDTFKKIISGRIRATRTVLYKFCIGLELTLPQAEDLFLLSEDGELTENNIGDFIFLHALGKDSIYSFIDEYEKYVHKKISLR